MAEPVIVLRDVVKNYYLGSMTVPVLRGISMAVNEGDFLSIMGPSGSGKSTLMNILGCLDRPTSGSYLLAGEEVATLNDTQLAHTRNKRIGFVFQSFNLLTKLSALDNVILPLIYAGVPAAERRERATRLLQALGLGERLDHLPAELSGGQRQRVAIARALVNDPSIVMADEPTGNLDSRSGYEVMEILSELHRQGRTILLVTHEQDIAEYATSHVELHDGVIINETDGTT
ncbi:MAG: ABC transporter ATP-binding protein [Veillonellaceae bacterium]|nr:ABC transporter ATP-binding protein [Veillonellaceae bacterium]